MREVKQPGEWEGPGGVTPQQRLIIVSVTYRGVGMTSTHMTTKMAPLVHTLVFGDRCGFVRGLSAILTKPVLNSATFSYWLNA